VVQLKKNYGHAPTRRWKGFDDMYIRTDTIPECDGQTDRRMNGFVITISRSACIAC